VQGVQLLELPQGPPVRRQDLVAVDPLDQAAQDQAEVGAGRQALRAGVGQRIWHREPSVGAPGNAPESLGSHRPDPEAVKRTCVRLAPLWRCWMLADKNLVGMAARGRSRSTRPPTAVCKNRGRRATLSAR
jgi:hypothetical protein